MPHVNYEPALIYLHISVYIALFRLDFSWLRQTRMSLRGLNLINRKYGTSCSAKALAAPSTPVPPARLCCSSMVLIANYWSLKPLCATNFCRTLELFSD